MDDIKACSCEGLIPQNSGVFGQNGDKSFLQSYNIYLMLKTRRSDNKNSKDQNKEKMFFIMNRITRMSHKRNHKYTNVSKKSK